ncbi:hypothetical protein [Terricaulis sp.]|uniref:hypothetical protein n=1 Tax=Terricaulis sp. TaxID=2768686 RepID=UPI003783EE2F
MRLFLCAALLALAACGQNPPPPPADDSAGQPPPLEQDLLTGAIVAGGDGWRLDADPSAQAIQLTMVNGDTASAPYQSPERTPSGYRLAGDGLTLDLELAPCTTEGVDYPMRATAQARGQMAVTGCAVVRWDAQLLRRMPQIDACMGISPQTRYVTYAGGEGRDTLVRMNGPAGAVDCSFENGEPRVGPRNESMRRASDGDAIFVRAQPGSDPGPQPGGECFTAPEVRGEDGVLLGWMDDPQGC